MQEIQRRLTGLGFDTGGTDGREPLRLMSIVTSPASPPRILARVRKICLALPDVVEEQAWVGVRWTIRKRNFAHV